MVTYQESNAAWQLQQLSQNGREWLGWQASRFFSRVPTLERPAIENWSSWERLIFHGLLWLGIALAIAFLWSQKGTWRRYWAHLTDLDLRPNFTQGAPGVNHWQNLAKEKAQQGDYYQACRYLYLAFLVKLQEKQWATPDPARTDQEYQQLIASLPQAALYQEILTIHQQLCFGQQPASQELFHHCQTAIAALETKPKP